MLSRLHAIRDKHCIITSKERAYYSNWEKFAEYALQSKLKNAPCIGNALHPAPFEHWSDAFDQLIKQDVKTAQICGKTNEILEWIQPHILCGKEGFIIDPYFDTTSERSDALIKSIFDIAKGTSFKRLFIISRCREKDLETTFDDWINPVESLFKNSHLGTHLTVNMVMVSKQYLTKHASDYDLHDRYFLTEKSIINFGKGFTIKPTKKPSYTVAILNSEDHTQIRDNFIRHIHMLSTQSHTHVAGFANKTISHC